MRLKSILTASVIIISSMSAIYPTNILAGSTSRFVFLMDGDDNFIGGPENNIVDGGAGNNTVNGGAGINTLFYRNRTSSISLNLSIKDSLGFSTVTFGGSTQVDKVKNFQNIIGGSGINTFFGDNNDNVFEGGPGADSFNGGSGGSDKVGYAHSKSGVTVNLKSPKLNTGDAKGDIYTRIQNIEGSTFNDILVGNTGPNIITGGAGADTLTGGGGKDTFKYNAINDSSPTALDIITDFNAGTATNPSNIIDLSNIDADPKTDGRQSFSFIGTNSFSGKAGELRVAINGSNTEILTDTAGKGQATFRIILKNYTKITAIKANNFKL